MPYLSCNLITVHFTQKGREAKDIWLRGGILGFRLYKEGHDDGLLFTIKLKIKATTVFVGCNKEVKCVPHKLGKPKYQPR